MDSFNITRVLHDGENHISFIECQLCEFKTVSAQELINQVERER